MNNPKLTSQGPGDPSLTPTVGGYATHDLDFSYQDNVDNVAPFHPLNVDYFMPVNVQRVVTARLSFKLRTYRTYSNFSVTGTSGQSADHSHANAGGETGHSHSHNHASHSHTIPIDSGASPSGIFWGGSGTNLNWTGGAGVTTHTAAIDATTPTTDASGSSGHSHSGSTAGASNDHTHNVSGSSFLGISDGALAATVSIKFDGVDQTAALGGPFSTDQIELDVTKYVSTKVDKIWHTVSLQTGGNPGLGRIQAVLRVLYISNPI